MPRIHRPKQHLRLAIYVFVFLTFISACTPGSKFPFFGSTPVSPTPPASPDLQAEVVFRVQVPFSTPGDFPIYLEMVDEITGLGLNPLRYQMEAHPPNHYSIRLPIQIGSVVKYRYLLGKAPLAIENTSYGNQVRYRMYPVNGTDMVQDIVAAWSGVPYIGETGRIFGTVSDQITGEPIPDVMVTAGGVQTISAADGNFLLDGLPQGTHHLVAYNIHGSYSVYEQGALVAPTSLTLAEIHMKPAQYVNVSFIVNTPKLPVDIAQVRMVGNLYSLGNTFADLRGGINTVASRSPQLNQYDDGRFVINLKLPVGFDLRYKYTMGDGFWNAEYGGGKFRVRQLIIPSEDIVIEDTVETWASGEAGSIVFIARVPTNTPIADVITIQFNPYAWLEPIPMWQAGPYEWIYILSSPLELLGNVSYRYCRNGYCPEGDDQADQSPGGAFMKGPEIQYFQDQIDHWPYLSAKESGAAFPSLHIEARGISFLAGVEYAPSFHPDWSAYQDGALTQVDALNGTLLVLTPTWTYTQQNPPLITPVPGKDGLWADWIETANKARQKGISLAVYPEPSIRSDSMEWWAGAERDLSWWYSWYDRYQTFILHHARLAQQMGATALIIGGPDIAPSYPDGLLPDGTSSGTPDEAESRWFEIIHEIRNVYQGQLVLALAYDGNVISPPPFTKLFDQIYLLWPATLPEIEGDSEVDAVQMINRLLERDVRPLRMNTGKPVILSVEYCSSTDQDCGVGNTKTGGSSQIDIQIQEILYTAALTAINAHNWIDGFVSRGYFPVVEMEDGSSSVYGKPAWNVLEYWYPQLLKDAR
jgi:hypothetical protein